MNNEVIKAGNVIRFIKAMLKEKQKTLAIEAIMLIYDTNVVDASNYVNYLELKNE